MNEKKLMEHDVRLDGLEARVRSLEIPRIERALDRADFAHACRALSGGEVMHFPIMASLCGVRLRDVHIRMTRAQLVDARVQAWLSNTVLPHLHQYDEEITVLVRP